jgi:hypothetical protein
LLCIVICRFDRPPFNAIKSNLTSHIKKTRFVHRKRSPYVCTFFKYDEYFTRWKVILRLSSTVIGFKMYISTPIMCYAKSKKKWILKFRLAFLTAVTSAYSATKRAMIITQLSVCRIGMNSQRVNRTSVATAEGKKVVYYSISTPFSTANTTANETDSTHHAE